MMHVIDADGKVQTTAAGGGVNGPDSSTDKAVPRFSGTGGHLLQNSGVTIDDQSDRTEMPKVELTRSSYTPILCMNELDICAFAYRVNHYTRQQ